MNRFGIIFATLSCLALAGCGGTSQKQLAGPEGNKDGQSLAAKPGMGRVYLIQGYLTDGPVPVDAVTDGAPDFYVYTKDLKPGAPYVPPPRLTAMGVGSMVGSVAAAIIEANRDKPARYVRLKPLSPRSFFYVGGNKIADIGEGDYLALDLPPGHYDIKLCLGIRDCPVLPVAVEEGKVLYFLSDADTPYGPYFEVCRKDCGQMVMDGRRVIALDPVKGVMQPR